MKLSVILVCYNQKDFIAQAIESALNQITDFDYEIIIGDDCSTDGTSKVIENYAKDNSQIKYYRHGHNKGLLGNYRFCHFKAIGTYIATLDGDDYWIDQYKLSKQVSMLDNNQSMGMVHTQYDNLFMYPKFLGRRYVRNVLSDHVAKRNCTLEGIYTEYAVRSSTVCYRRGIIQNSNILQEFDANTFPVEDWPIHIQCSMGWKVGYISNSTTVYRINRNSLSHFNDNNARIEFIESMQQVKNYFSTQITVSKNAEARWHRSIALSEAHHFYKSNDYFSFLEVFRNVNNRPFVLYFMFLVLWLKRNEILKSEDVFKR